MFVALGKNTTNKNQDLRAVSGILTTKEWCHRERVRRNCVKHNARRTSVTIQVNRVIVQSTTLKDILDCHVTKLTTASLVANFVPRNDNSLEGTEKKTMKRFVLIMLSIFTCAIATAATETTEWWVDGEVYATTSCETGGDISTPPQNPTKKGYTFQGWETAVYDMSTLDATINGTDFTFNSNTHKWRIKFSYGYVYGESLCSSISGDQWYPGLQELDTSSSGGHCWCRVTEFFPTGSAKVYEVSSPHWVYLRNDGSGCNGYCTDHCSDYPRNRQSLRESLYGTN